MKRGCGIILATWALTALAGGPLGAQEDEIGARGFAAEATYDFKDLDSVNLFNGNLTLAIPIGPSYPVGGGLDYQLTLVYNSLVWDVRERQEVDAEGTWRTFTSPAPSVASNAGLGWTLTLGMLFPPGNDPVNDSSFWMYVAPDGGRHHFYDKLYNKNDGSAAPEDVEYTLDSTYLRMRKLDEWTREIDFPDGRVHRFADPVETPEADWRLEEIRDLFGNRVSVLYGEVGGREVWTLDDGHRTHTVRFTDGPAGGGPAWEAVLGQQVEEVELAAFGGQTALYRFEYATADNLLELCYRNTDPLQVPPGSTVTVPLLTRIELPDGTAFETSNGPADHGYATTCSQAGDGEPGALRRLRLPTRGMIEWEYGSYLLPASARGSGQAPRYWDAVVGVLERRLADRNGQDLGTTRYANELVTVSTPEGDELPVETRTYVEHPVVGCERHFFEADAAGSWDYGLPFSTRDPPLVVGGTTLYLASEVYAAAVAVADPVFGDPAFRCGGAPLRAEYSRWDRDPYSYRPRDANRWLVESRTVYLDDVPPAGESSRWASSRRTRTALGQTTERRLDGNLDDEDPSHPSDDRVTGASFVHGFPWVISYWEPWLPDLEDKLWTTGGAWTAVCHDAQGFLEKRRRYKDGSLGRRWNDQLTFFARDAAGNVVAERSYGGDLQPLPSTSLCNLLESQLPAPEYEVRHTWAHGALASSVYLGEDDLPLPFRSVDRTIDADTGLAAASRDVAGIETVFSYDALGRLVSARPAAGHDAWTEYLYVPATDTAPARVEVERLPNGGGAPLARTAFLFDDLGRLEREEVWRPGGVRAWRDTAYNGRGWKTRVSTWYEPGSPLGATEYLQHDAFGRPGVIRPPDGAAHDVVLSYSGARQIDRQLAVGGGTSVTSEQYDRLGRLRKVVEPSGFDGAPTPTVYTYDADDRLIHVESTGIMNGAGDYEIQHRYFNYDKLGNLRSEQLPELYNGFYYYGDYDSRGHAGYGQKRWSGNWDDSPLRYTWDRAERLTAIDEVTNSTGTESAPLKRFAFGGENVLGEGGAVDSYSLGKLVSATRYNDRGPTVEERYEYGGPGGRASARETYFDGALAFDQGFGWTELGQTARLVYPTCYLAGCAAPALTVDYVYEEGLLNAVPGYASSITYHPSGMVHEIVHADGSKTVWEADPDGMTRPHRIRTETASPAEFDTGVYSYDGAGNITAMGPDTYDYDGVSRLTRGNAAGGLYETFYEYDAFGNRAAANFRNGRGRSLSEVTECEDSDPFPAAYEALALPGTPSVNRLRPLRTSQPYYWYVTYDARGNLTRWAREDAEDLSLYEYDERYAYDAMNMLTAREAWGDEISYDAGASECTLDGHALQSGERYAYTADDERVEKGRYVVTETEVEWSVRDLAGRVLRSFGSTGGASDAVWAAGRLLSVDGLHYHLDHLGTPRAHSSANAIVARRDYLPFGEPAPLPAADRFQFTAHERHVKSNAGLETGHGGDAAFGSLDYMHARFYSPHLGRFLSMDSLDGNPAKPQSWNRYSYVQNQPINFFDRTGLYREDFHNDVTEILALAVGYSPADARSIAAATHGVDTDLLRGPYLGALFGSLPKYHFVSDERLGELFVQALSSQNLADIGTFLHAGQDRFSHEGFTSCCTGPVRPLPGHLAAGSAPDITANDPDRALRTAEWTFRALTALKGKAPRSPFSGLSSLLLTYLSREEKWDDARERDLALLRARIRELSEREK